MISPNFDLLTGVLSAVDVDILLARLDHFAGAIRKGRYSRLLENPRRLLLSKLLEVGLRAAGRTRAIEGETFWGDTMHLVSPELVSLFIQRYGFFDEAMSRFFLQHVKSGMTVFDVGAHFGYFTLLASRLVGNSGMVHSFEPTPDTYTILERNVVRRENVHLNNIAVDNSSGSLDIVDCGPRFSAFNSAERPRLPEGITARLRPRKICVKAVSLDEYAGGHFQPDFVKIDAEGAEIRVLLGMEDMISSFRPVIALEVGDHDIPGVPPSRDVIRFLVDRRYEVYEYREGKITLHNVRWGYADGNLLFLPR